MWVNLLCCFLHLPRFSTRFSLLINPLEDSTPIRFQKSASFSCSLLLPALSLSLHSFPLNCEARMGEGGPEKVEVTASCADVAPPPPPTDAAKDVADEKAEMPPAAEEKPDYCKALAIVEKVADPAPAEKNSGSIERDAVLARVETQKRQSLIKAWEENEKSKIENKAEKKLSDINSWENTKKAAVEAELKKIEESLEKKKAEYAEKMKNKICRIHKTAEERRAIVEAKKGEDLLKAEEMAAKYRIKGIIPKKVLGFFSS